MEKEVDNFKDIIWNRDSYSSFIKRLLEEQDSKYREFNLGILGVNKNLIGIRTPRLKVLAKEIAKGDWKAFIKIAARKYYEESVLKGLVIGYAHIDKEERIQYIENFIEDIDNWAVCDICIGNFKFIKKDLEYYYPFVKECLEDTNPWKIRVGIVVMLDYYMEDNYLDEIFSSMERITDENYYVKMAQSWLISIAFIKYKERTIEFLQKNRLSSWVQNKAIQKIRESLRVTKEDKEKIIEYKKK